MKLIIDTAHQEYFQTNGYVQFEQVLTPEKIAFINKYFHKDTRDNWRKVRDFNKNISQRQLAKIAAELTKYGTIRMGYDQFLKTPISFPSESSLSEVSCLQGIPCALLICLKDSEDDHEIFPTHAGDISFIHPKVPLPWDQLNLLGDLSYLLIVYTHERGVYHREDRDPFTHQLKEFGYSYGDRLKDEFNPILYS